METRRLHPAPLDYGIVEHHHPEVPQPVFILYRWGIEFCRCETARQAWTLAETDRARSAALYHSLARLSSSPRMTEHAHS